MARVLEMKIFKFHCTTLSTLINSRYLRAAKMSIPEPFQRLDPIHRPIGVCFRLELFAEASVNYYHHPQTGRARDPKVPPHSQSPSHKLLPSPVPAKLHIYS